MFEKKTLKEISEMTFDEQSKYQIEKEANEAELRKKEIEDAIAKAQENNVSKEDLTKLNTELKEHLDEIERISLAIKGNSEGVKPMPNALKQFITDNSEVLKNIKANKTNAKAFDITLKGSQVAPDIVGRDAYAQIEAGTIRKPVRSTAILPLFRRKPVSTEYFKYREENVVTRDAKFVTACATSTHTTKKTWEVKTVEMAKIRDIIDACIDMLDDYTWVEAELKELINESIKLKADYELLLGTGTGATDMLSINTIASEFDPANVLAPFTGAFQDANLEQLVDAMGAQISVFGEQNSWMAGTVVMNFTDFVKYRNLKDANGNKLIQTMSDSIATIAGMEVITSPIVAPNTLYVFDKNQGEILDRQSISVKTSFENKDNIEHETVTFVAVERIQFHVPTIKRDAFMKCSDVATAITTITAP